MHPLIHSLSHPSIHAFNLIFSIHHSIHHCINFLFYPTWHTTLQSLFNPFVHPPLHLSHHFPFLSSRHACIHFFHTPINSFLYYLLFFSFINLSISHPCFHPSINGCNHHPCTFTLHSLHKPLGWAHQARQAADDPQAQDGYVQQALPGSQAAPAQPEMEQAGQYKCHGGTSYATR